MKSAVSPKARRAKIGLGVSVALFATLIGLQIAMPHRPLLQSFCLCASSGFFFAGNLWNKQTLAAAGWVLLVAGMVLVFHPIYY